MAKGYIKPAFGFEPIDNEPFLSDVTFATEAAASNHAKNGVSSYPGKILTVATGSSTTIYQVNPDKSIEAIPTVSMIAANTEAANASLSSLQSQINDLKAQDTSIKNYINVLDSSHTSYTNTQVGNLKTYVNTQDTSILNAAKADSKSKADTALASAKSYTDSSLLTLKEYVDKQIKIISDSIKLIDASLAKAIFY